MLSPRGREPLDAVLPTILVVDDNEDDLFLLQKAFERAPVDAVTHWVQGGLTAKDFLDRAIQGEHRLPLCVVLDLKMPIMDGFALLSYIKSHPTLSSLPVIVLSGSDNPADVDRAHSLGAKSYFVKPSGIEGLVEVSRMLRDQWMSLSAPPRTPAPET
jgi:CheY-like chemotaxis protein